MAVCYYCGSAHIVAQCPGHKSFCGRFFCAVHALEGLCQDCGNERTAEQAAKLAALNQQRLEKERQKQQAQIEAEQQRARERIAVEYADTVKRIYRKNWHSGCLLYSALAIIGVTIALPLWAAAGEIERNTPFGDPKPPEHTVYSVLLFLSFVLMGVVFYFGRKKVRRISMERIERVAAAEPLFRDLYDQYAHTQRERDKKLLAVLAFPIYIVGALLLFALAVGAAESENSVEKDVKDIKRKLGA